MALQLEIKPLKPASLTVENSASGATLEVSALQQPIELEIGGIGVQGPPGPEGPPGVSSATLDELVDVTITSVTDGDVLSYSAVDSKWVNGKAYQLVDGGNF